MDTTTDNQRTRKVKSRTRRRSEWLSPTLSTTTSLGRVRGFTVELLFHLKDGPRRCCDLAEITDKTQPYVRRYLGNMWIYGLVEKDGVLWNLSVLGEDFLSYLNIVYNNILEYRKKKERKKKDKRKKKESSQPKKAKQVPLLPFTRNLSLDDTERRVVEVLVAHYDETGSKFILVKDKYELAERMGLNPNDIGDALKNLHEDHRVYKFTLRREGLTKIGLYKAFIESLKIKDAR